MAVFQSITTMWRSLTRKLDDGFQLEGLPILTWKSPTWNRAKNICSASRLSTMRVYLSHWLPIRTCWRRIHSTSQANQAPRKPTTGTRTLSSCAGLHRSAMADLRLPSTFSKNALTAPSSGSDVPRLLATSARLR
uniref:(northern house mosquito) hypothetical protein n=1 Tax=Culex pipiens TaxID=7175 RepID=A0A8D8JVU5_CULPI